MSLINRYYEPIILILLWIEVPLLLAAVLGVAWQVELRTNSTVVAERARRVNRWICIVSSGLGSAIAMLTHTSTVLSSIFMICLSLMLMVMMVLYFVIIFRQPKASPGPGSMGMFISLKGDRLMIPREALVWNLFCGWMPLIVFSGILVSKYMN